jgi:hypothetical protein
MRTRRYLSAVEARQAGRKDRHEKRPGASEHTRPSFFAARQSQIASKDQQLWV